MTGLQRQGVLASRIPGACRRKLWHTVACATFLLPPFLFGCSSLSFAPENAPAAGPDPSYSKVIANRLYKFKDIDSYYGFEISDYRWLHSLKGWTWLACVRYQDHGRTRTYALFLSKDDIVLDRFAVAADGCDAQNYVPFALMTNGAKPTSAGALEPLY